MTKLIFTSLLLLLVGCQSSTTPTTTSSSTQTPLAVVAASEEALEAAGMTILACYNIPVCNKVANRKQIALAYDTADEALKIARSAALAGNQPDMSKVQAALQGLQTLVSALPKS